ncbi:MAG: phosphoribosylformylglycinamidine synthase subunit PurS [Frankiales bacterium]|nr:phosphoribosylformylglycinamidine synthase subunit PurS [Frankiales bacterium]
MPVHKVLVDVLLKPEILDPQGQAVANALPSLGFPAPTSVRIGKHVEVEVDAESADAAVEQVEKMAEVLLANPVIEDFRVRLA